MAASQSRFLQSLQFFVAVLWGVLTSSCGESGASALEGARLAPPAPVPAYVGGGSVSDCYDCPSRAGGTMAVGGAIESSASAAADALRGGAMNGGAGGGWQGGASNGGTGETGEATTGSAAEALGSGGRTYFNNNASSGAANSSDPSSAIYDPERLPVFYLTLPRESVDALNQDPKSYVHGSLVYESEQLFDVGIRLKGEYSMRDLSGKSAFRIKFDEFVDKQTFHGLRSITLNNLIEDCSFIAERLAYTLFRAASPPAPRCNSARVFVNGEYYGLYANVETEDKTFLRRWFARADGNLYEEQESDFVPGAEARFELETNEKSNDRSDLTRLIDAIQRSTADTLFQDLDPVLDMAQFLRFSAAEMAVNQWDMYSYNASLPNNFRIYHDPARQRFVFMPWGMDMSMKPYPVTGQVHLNVFELVRQAGSENGPITAGILFQRCLASAACRTAYADAAREVVAIYEQLDLGMLATRYYEQIRSAVYEDQRKECSNQKFEDTYRVVLENIEQRAALVRSQL